jgi:alkylhydroperoxidase family enzyme
MIRTLFVLAAGVALAPGQPLYPLARALGQAPQIARAEQALSVAMSGGGTVPSGLVVALGYQTAKELNSDFWTRRLRRLASEVADGSAILSALDRRSLAEGTSTTAALQLGRALALSPQGPGAATFRTARQHFTDAQLTEITAVVAYYSYAIRLAQALGPQESADDPLPKLGEPILSTARLSTPGPDQLSFLSELRANASPVFRLLFYVPQKGRSLLRLDAAVTSSASSDSRMPRLLAAFTSAHVNSCRYATTSAVHALLAAGVPAKKIAGAVESDRVYSASEAAVVAFARKVTIQPEAVTPADLRALEKTVGKRVAFDVLMASAWSALWQRLSDGIHLPPNPAAQRSYREVFGQEFPQVSEGQRKP